MGRFYLRLQTLPPVPQTYTVPSLKYTRGRRLIVAGNFSTSFHNASIILRVVGLSHDAVVQAAHAPVSSLNMLTGSLS